MMSGEHGQARRGGMWEREGELAEVLLRGFLSEHAASLMEQAHF